MEFSKVKQEIANRKEQYVNELLRLVRQPSISSQNIGVEDCAALLKEMMEEAGIHARIMETAGSPVVYGEVMHPENEVTILFYGHYDVQPPEPLEEWVSPPFEPTIRDGKVYGRGTGDNKGQLLAHVLAVKTMLDLEGRLPVNVKFLFEGEEENTSHNLEPFIRDNLDHLEADIAYTADGPMDASGKPYVMLGNRGMLYIQLTAQGASHDNHSGNKGGIAPNPAWELIHLLGTMYSPDGRVLIDGFYDDIRKPTETELANLRKVPLDPVKTAEVVGIEKLEMDQETYYRKITLEPTFNINGLESGYTGKGQKTIIPSTAMVKLDMRLAADQDPEKIFSKLKEHVTKHAPKVMVEKLGSVKPSRTPYELEIVQKVIGAVRASHGTEPIVLPAIGATGPMYVFTDILKQPHVCVPYANADEDNHAPNENMGVKEYLQGIETSCKVLIDLGE